MKNKNSSFITQFYYFALVYVFIFTLDDGITRFFLSIPCIVFLLFFSFKHKKYMIISIVFITVFIASLFYDKSTSNFFHPIVGKEFTLKKSLYLYNFNSRVQVSQYKPNTKNFARLSQGEKIKVGALFTKFPLPFENHTIALYTPKNHIFKNVKNIQKLEDSLYILLYPNSLFYELNILNDTTTNLYDTIPRYFFQIAYLTYPFILFGSIFILLFHIQNKKINFYMYKTIRFTLYFITYFYIYFAATNDGWTGFFYGIIYALFLLYEILKNRQYRYFHIIFLTACALFYFSDRTTWNIKYPHVNKAYTIQNDINYSYSFYINEIAISYIEKNQQHFTLKKGDTIFIKNQFVSSYADMGTAYSFVLHSKRFDEYKNYIKNNKNRVKDILSQDFEKSFHEQKTKFYMNEKNKIYIGEHNLKKLLESQGYKFSTLRPYQHIADLFFSIFIYLSILVVFIFLVIFQNTFYKTLQNRAAHA